MINKRKHRGYWWVYENCHSEALLYTTKKDFQINGRGAYAAASKKGWLDKICSHMIPMSLTFDVYGYAIEFIDLKKVYVGITCDLDRRKWQHLSNTNNKCKSSNKFVRDLVNAGYSYLWIPIDGKGDRYTAKAFEQSIIDEYTGKGWEILNIKKAGALGSCRKYWTKKRLGCEALKYSTKKEFYTKNFSAYCAAQRMGLLSEINSHMASTKKLNGYWTDKDTCVNVALLCKKQSEFRKKYPSAYKEALRNGWLGGAIVFPIIPKNKDGAKTKKIFFWTKENCAIESLKYSNRTQFQRGSKSAYHAARRNKWLNELCVHMELKKRAAGYWTFDECKLEALKYKTRGEFSIKSTAYVISKKKGWLNEVCTHMVSAWALKKKTA